MEQAIREAKDACPPPHRAQTRARTPELVERIEQAIDLIEDDSPRSRRHQISTPPLNFDYAWVISVPNGRGDWNVVWSLDQTGKAIVVAIVEADLV